MDALCGHRHRRRAATLDYRSVWKRNDDPGRISTFVDDGLKAKLAGTTTIGNERLDSTAFGYQVLAGRRLPAQRANVARRQAAMGGFRRVRERRNALEPVAQTNQASAAARQCAMR